MPPHIPLGWVSSGPTGRGVQEQAGLPAPPQHGTGSTKQCCSQEGLEAEASPYRLSLYCLVLVHVSTRV